MLIATQAALAAVAGGVRVVGDLPPQLRFSTDTRSLAPGDAFVALRGERFDGHAFIAGALAAGAACIVVSDADAAPPGVAAIVVADTTQAYLAFAAAARAASRARVVAITGSAGKTTTKTLLAQLLERAAPGRVAATFANENNAIGVAKLLLAVPADAAFVVVEFGARHFGEIEPLARAAAPEVAVLTNVGDAHLEIMGSRERLAQTKWGIFATGARRVLNGDDAVSATYAAAERSRVERPEADDSSDTRSLPQSVWFAARQADAVAECSAVPAGIKVPATGASLVLCGRDTLVVSERGFVRRLRTAIDIPGDHNVANVAAAAAAALALGIDAGALADALPDLRLPEGRYERLALGALDVIYDAYNASMSGSLATLASFGRETAARRIAVLGSMAELGPEAAAMHARVGAAAAASGLAALLVGGEFAEDLARGARTAGMPAARIVAFARNAEATEWLRAHSQPGDLVLLKASRRYKLEEILDGLRTAHA